jgi:hypothetical protein
MRGIVQQLTERMHQTPEQALSGSVTTRANANYHRVHQTLILDLVDAPPNYQPSKS